MKKLLMLLMTVICMAVIAGCGGSVKAPSAQNEKVLKVGLDVNFPPFEYYQESSKAFTGFDVELMRGVAENMGYSDVEFVPTGLGDLIKGLNDKKYDVVVSGFSITPERQNQVDFSEPYLHDGFRVAVPAGINIKGGVEVLEGRRVAVKDNSFALDMVNDYGKASKVITTESIEAAMNKVIDGEADCCIISKSAGNFFINNGYGDKIKFASDDLKTDSVAAAVRKGDTELLNSLNEGLRNFRKSQEFDRLKKNYFGDM